MRRSLQKLHLGLAASRRFPPASLHCRRHLSAVFAQPPHTTFLDVTPDAGPGTSAKAYKLKELAASLSAEPTDSSRLWKNYSNLVNFMGYEVLPLEVHQAVLRKCTLSTWEIRKLTAQKLQDRTMSFRKPYHIHEERFQVILRNIRATGEKPSLDDFHFILLHFASAGHHLGTQKIMSELIELGITPTHKTYGLCLQALAHRLALPFADHARQTYVSEISLIGSQLLSDMAKQGIPITSVNLDLAFRILREGGDEAGLSKLLKVGYGIDLEYLDQPPLEDNKAKALLGTVQVPALQPISTHTLNTIIDALGRMGHLSKMVAVFEVLTQPLPSPQPKPNESSFEDEDDDDFPIIQTRPTWQPPHVVPNTTTYNMLVKYTAIDGNLILAQHYAKQIMDVEEMNRNRIRLALEAGTPLGEIEAPRVSLNRLSLLPIHGRANRGNDIGTLRWIKAVCRMAKGRKFREYKWWTEYLEQNSSTEDGEAEAPELDRPAYRPDAISTILDADLDSPPATSFTPLAPKKLDPKLHMALLLRDREQLESLRQQNGNALHSAIQRAKQRMGRRVWKGMDVFMLDEGRRVPVSKDEWTEMVNFKRDKSVSTTTS